ncbi:MAG: LysR family transcriptional regulator [Hyphomicrobiaceae bacterium]
MINLQSLKALVEVERVSSFSLAAERLGLTLSAISVQMKTLERALGLPLFDRTSRPPAMTPEARRVAAHARTILAELEAMQALGAGADRLTGSYRIGFIPTAVVRLMPQFLTAAATEHPGAAFEVESGLTTDLLPRIRRGELDAALVTEPASEEPGLHFTPLYTERFALAVPARARRWNLARCAGELVQIQLVRPASAIDALVTRRFTELGIRCATTQRLSSVEAAMECINAGIAFAVLPEPDARRYARDAVVRPVAEFPFSRRLGLLIRADGPMQSRIEALAALFPAEAATSPPAHRR